MTRVRFALLAILALLAVTAFSASPALAFTEFTSPEGEKMTGESQPETTQKFEATESEGKTTVTTTCKKAKVTSTIKGKKTELEGTPEFSECEVAGSKATVANKCGFDLHASGSVDLVGENCAIVEVAATKCVITITGSQKNLSKVTWVIKGLDLLGDGVVTNIKWTTKTGKACGFPADNVSGTATYTGSKLWKGLGMA